MCRVFNLGFALNLAQRLEKFQATLGTLPVLCVLLLCVLTCWVDSLHMLFSQDQSSGRGHRLRLVHFSPLLGGQTPDRGLHRSGFVVVVSRFESGPGKSSIKGSKVFRYSTINISSDWGAAETRPLKIGGSFDGH